MKFSYNWLQSFFKKKLPKPEKLAGLLTMHFAEVEEVKKQKEDFIMDIDIRPNRTGDCFSHFGIVKEIAAITGLKYEDPILEFKEDKSRKAKNFVSVKVKSLQSCPRYTARIIADVTVGFSPKWMRDRLEACGLKSINNIVDIANYVMLETGQPIHAFDGEKLDDKKIIVRFAKKGEKIITLDKEKYELDEEVLVIADSKKPVAIAGIKGGLSAKIDLKTKIVVLESANFNSQVIRQGSKRIDLKTDASWRFEHGIDANFTEIAANRAAFLIQETAYSQDIFPKVAQGLIDIYPKKVLPKKIKLNLDYVEKLLGIKINFKEIKDILRKLGFKCKENGSNSIIVEVPTGRLDVLIQEDLIEEIGRIYGYEKIPAKFPFASLIPPKRNLDIFWEDMIKDILKEVGFAEVYSYSFISEKEREFFKYPKEEKSGSRKKKKNRELIEIENPVSSDFQYLRPSLIPNLLKNIEKNQRNFTEIKIFEFGKIFQKPNIEKKMLSGAIIGEDFYRLKGIIDLLFNKIGISNIWYNNYKPTPEESKISFWQPGKCAEIKVNHEEAGFLGEISPKILNNFKINRPQTNSDKGKTENETKVLVFDIDFEKLSKIASEEHEYRPISRFPSAVRDVAILVPKEIKVEEVLNKIENLGGFLIRDIELFDIYEGEELPEGKKNLAFHIIYQSQDRTLTSEEIDQLQKKVISALEKSSGWEVRK